MSSRTGQLTRVFIPFALGYFLSYVYRVVNAVIAPDLVRDLGLDPSGLGMLTSAYFLTFAAFQLPLGILLDRYGPRRVEAGLLLVAALGAFVFSISDSLAAVVVGRALIGFGVSACLMAAFKAFVLWFPINRLPLVNGMQMAAGGLGALFATAPVEVALGYMNWRGLFAGLAVLTLLVAAAVFWIVPEHSGSHHEETLADQMRGIRQIMGSRVFWRIAPWTIASQAVFLSVQGLWSGPWLRDVAGYSRMAVADTLFLIAVAMIAGFLSLGALAEFLSRRGIRPIVVAGFGMTLFMLVQLMLVLQVVSLTVPLWVLFGFFGTTNILPYAVLSQSFPAHLAGRANTGLNVFVFLAAFAGQWGIGAIIDLWSPLDGGLYQPQAYQAAFALMLGLQVISAIWFFISSAKTMNRSEGSDLKHR